MKVCGRSPAAPPPCLRLPLSNWWKGQRVRSRTQISQRTSEEACQLLPIVGFVTEMWTDLCIEYDQGTKRIPALRSEERGMEIFHRIKQKVCLMSRIRHVLFTECRKKLHACFYDLLDIVATRVMQCDYVTYIILYCIYWIFHIVLFSFSTVSCSEIYLKRGDPDCQTALRFTLCLKKEQPIMHSLQGGERVSLHPLSINRSWWLGSVLDHGPPQKAQSRVEELHFMRPNYMRHGVKNTKRKEQVKG